MTLGKDGCISFKAYMMDNSCLFGRGSEETPASQHNDIVLWLCENLWYAFDQSFRVIFKEHKQYS